MAVKGKVRESGQSVMLFAIVIPLSVLFALGIIDYMITNVRVMELVAVTDLAAHAGAQVIETLPDGRIQPVQNEARQRTAMYFEMQAPAGAVLKNITCGLLEERPSCQVRAAIESAGYLLPKRWIHVNAVGSLAYGVTYDGQ